MKKLLEKNKFLFMLIAISLVISFILILLIYHTNNEKELTNTALENLKLKIWRLNNYRPSPTEKNINTIKEDLKYVNEETIKLEGHFGGIYNNALDAFIESLDRSTTARTEKSQRELKAQLDKKPETKSPKNKKKFTRLQNEPTKVNNKLANYKKCTKIELKQKFISNWKTFVEKQKGKDEYLESSEVLDKFRIFGKYSKDEFAKARNAFKDVFQQNTIEKITKLNLNDYILAALGLPLDLTRISCRKFVVNIQKTLDKKLKKAKIISPSENLRLFNEFTTIPNDDQISYIIKYCRLYEDLFSRMVKSKIETLVSYKKLNGLRGTKTGDFLILKYELHVISSLNAIRSFLNSLQNAYNNNKVYVIADIKMIKVLSNVDKLKSYEEFGINPRQESVFKKEEIKQSDDNQIVIELGTSDLVKTSIKLDYIIYDKPII